METLFNSTPEDRKKLDSFFDPLLGVEIDKPYMVSRPEIVSLIESGISAERILYGFVEHGFLLHGSCVEGLTELEPRQANDESDNADNKRRAVYATTDQRIPLFMSLVGGISGKSGYDIFGRSQEDGVFVTESVIFTTSFDIPKDKMGYVYVLPKDTFEVAGGTQLTSPLPVAPKYVIPVTLSDFPYPIRKIVDVKK